MGDTPQHIRALEQANVIRLGRARLKREIRNGGTTVEEVIHPRAEIPEVAQSMTVSQLLCAQVRWGATRARKLLASVGIREGKALGNLTVRQRRHLIDALADNEAHLARKNRLIA